MITAYGSVEVAVNALKSGANDYFSKPWDNEKLLIEIDRMIAHSRLARENAQLKRALKQQYSFPNIIGKNDRMLRILDLVTQVAPSRATILITGETGTGKELIAKAIHANSARADQPFVPVNSGSVPADLLESALFGHVKGAFTGAIASRKGLFRDRQQGHHLLRRNRHHQSGNAGQAAARDPGARVHAGGIDRNHQGGRAHHRGHQRRSEEAGGRRQVSRGSVLPAERHQPGAAAAAGTQGRHSARWWSIFFTKYSRENEKFLDAERQEPAAVRAGRHAAADGLQLAGQRARAGKRRGARGGAGVATRPCRWTCCPDSILQAGGVTIRRDESGTLPADASLFEIVADFERRKIIEALEAVNWSQTEAAEKLHIPLSTLNQKIKRLSIDVKRKGQSGGG